MKHVGIQQMADVSSTPATYAASAVSVIAGLTVTEWQAVGVIGGLILGTLTFATNLYFKHKHHKLSVRKHEEDR